MEQGNPAEVVSFWNAVSGDILAQGDFLIGCLIPVIPPDLDEKLPSGSTLAQVDSADLIVMTQSCDLQNDKAPLVACCPIHSLHRFEQFNPKFKKSGAWETVRQGRQEGLHLLASPVQPEDNASALVVDFRSIVSLPVGYLKRHAANSGQRWRLRSPYLEHFSQAFARFFMRVGLPSSIPPYRK